MNDEELLTLPDPQNKRELLERLAVGRQAMEALIDPLSEELLTLPLGEDGWSIKDHLAHLMVWERGMVALLHQKPRYEAMGLTLDLAESDFDSLNDNIYRQHRHRPLGDVLASWRDTHQEMVETLAGLADDDLLRSYAHYQPNESREDGGAPVMGWIAGNTYGHYAEHAGWIREKLAGR